MLPSLHFWHFGRAIARRGPPASTTVPQNRVGRDQACGIIGSGPQRSYPRATIPEPERRSTGGGWRTRLRLAWTGIVSHEERGAIDDDGDAAQRTLGRHRAAGDAFEIGQGGVAVGTGKESSGRHEGYSSARS